MRNWSVWGYFNAVSYVSSGLNAAFILPRNPYFMGINSVMRKKRKVDFDKCGMLFPAFFKGQRQPSCKSFLALLTLSGLQARTDYLCGPVFVSSSVMAGFSALSKVRPTMAPTTSGGLQANGRSLNPCDRLAELL